MPKSGPIVVFINSVSPRTLRALLFGMYVPRRMADCKPASVSDYTQAIDALRAFTACEPTLDQLSDDLIETFAAWSARSGRSPVTVNKRITQLCTLWKFAFRKKLLQELPRDIQKLRVPKRIPEAWSLEQFAKILKAAADEPGTIEGIPAALWFTGLLLVIFDTGLRVGAVLKLDASAVDIGTRWLTVPPEFQKQNAGQALRLHAQTTDVLARLPRTGKLFPVPWKQPKEPLLRWYEKILERAGLPHGHRDKFHRIRRTTGTLVANVGGLAAARQQLGHASEATTRKSYLDPRLSTGQFIATDLIARPTVSPLIEFSKAPNLVSLPPETQSTATISTPSPRDESPLPWLD